MEKKKKKKGTTHLLLFDAAQVASLHGSARKLGALSERTFVHYCCSTWCLYPSRSCHKICLRKFGWKLTYYCVKNPSRIDCDSHLNEKLVSASVCNPLRDASHWIQNFYTFTSGCFKKATLRSVVDATLYARAPRGEQQASCILGGDVPAESATYCGKKPQKIYLYIYIIWSAPNLEATRKWLNVSFQDTRLKSRYRGFQAKQPFRRCLLCSVVSK